MRNEFGDEYYECAECGWGLPAPRAQCDRCVANERLDAAGGVRCGLNADWIDPTWCFGPGPANQTGVAYYIVEVDEGEWPELILFRRTIADVEVDDESDREELAVLPPGCVGDLLARVAELGGHVRPRTTIDRLRAILGKMFELAPEYPFFSAHLRAPNEDHDAMLMRIFAAERETQYQRAREQGRPLPSDHHVLSVMAYG